jgi:hypothetical protein
MLVEEEGRMEMEKREVLRDGFWIYPGVGGVYTAHSTLALVFVFLLGSTEQCTKTRSISILLPSSTSAYLLLLTGLPNAPSYI